MLLLLRIIISALFSPLPRARSGGHPLLYVMGECWSLYPVVLYFPKTRRRLREAMDGKIRLLRESGLVQWWLRGRSSARRRTRETDRQVLTLERHLFGVLAALCACLAAAAAAFIAEVVFCVFCGGRG